MYEFTQLDGQSRREQIGKIIPKNPSLKYVHKLRASRNSFVPFIYFCKSSIC